MSHNFEFDLDLEELPPKLLRKIIRASMGKRAKKKMDEATTDDEEDEDDDLADDEDAAEEERDKLSKMAEEQRGEAPSVAVTKDDLPPGIADKLAKKKKKSS